jgi:tetratricopeptide (TPR) repeat protein
MPLSVMDVATRMQLVVGKAERKCDQQQCEEAINLLEEAVRIQPGDAQLYYQLGFCHSGGCRQHSQTDPDMAVEYLRHALSLAATSPVPLLRAKVLATLGNTLVTSRKGPPTDRLREAIVCHQNAAEIYQSENLPEKWAREEYNEANVWCDLPQSEFPEKWIEAVKHYENALQVRTKDKDPDRYAATVMNLGTALRQLPSADRAASVLEAVRCYHKALRVCTLEAFPAQFAKLCNNLGNACVSFPSRDKPARTRHVRDAIRHFERALQVWLREENECQYALLQYNRGCAYLLRGEPEDFSRALMCLSEAFERSRSRECSEIAVLARVQLDKIRPSLTRVPNKCLRPT